MSSAAIFIPDRPGGSPSSSSTSSEAPSPSASPATPPAGASGSPPPSTLPSSSSIYHRRRPSLLSSSVSRVEHSVFDLGIRDGSPRLITCVKASQGFDWNQDIFLPSSSEITIHNGIQKPETVHEIILSEDESFLPS
ncbi:hypothetical protein C7212DRAFT_354883 [Tuber magnatum]|uniref:Uncharacterized protein n=1 Tax=Tuber magnatum TaxID=42249 RepID=A0A317SG23_9PEZI|nr:hypothetical protein C7212DRAFT_354883 [Tuber magnatum]